jgi:hypothetical protein
MDAKVEFGEAKFSYFSCLIVTATFAFAEMLLLPHSIGSFAFCRSGLLFGGLIPALHAPHFRAPMLVEAINLTRERLVIWERRQYAYQSGPRRRYPDALRTG